MIDSWGTVHFSDYMNNVNKFSRHGYCRAGYFIMTAAQDLKNCHGPRRADLTGALQLLKGLGDVFSFCKEGNQTPRMCGSQQASACVATLSKEVIGYKKSGLMGSMCS